MNNTPEFDTLLIHAGEYPDPETGAVIPPLHRTKTFAQKFGEDQTYQYSRGKNPTRERLVEKLCALENGKYATVYASGVAASATFFLTLNPGDHILCCQEIYGGTYRQLEQLMPRFGITTNYVDFSTKESIIKGIKPNTKYLFVETPTNPSLHIIDLELVSQVSKETNIPFVVDSTFSPPCCTRPLDYGAKVVIQSLSKYIAGHNDVLAGALITNDQELHEKFYFLFRTVGAILSPDECYRVMQGVKTLSMRWQTVSNNADIISQGLTFCKKNEPSANLDIAGTIKNVYYPGLPEHPHHQIAKRQMKNGFGGVISFEIEDEYQKPNLIKKFVDATTKDKNIIYAESLASPETILAYPPLMSHKSLPHDVRLSLGITDGFFRLSVGFESPIDIAKSLFNGLAALKS
jgi:cystathionine gamma-lyase